MTTKDSRLSKVYWVFAKDGIENLQAVSKEAHKAKTKEENAKRKKK